MAYVYIPLLADVLTWENCEAPPVAVEKLLCDVCHCPAKDGATVTKVVQKQLARFGLTDADMVSGTGDGGGENEGHLGGVHQHMEEVQPSYVRRRCLNHVAWAVCRAGLEESGRTSQDAEKIGTYLAQGLTWFSMKALAVKPVVQGGLGLMQEGSREYKKVFSNMPASIIEGRPESAMNFLTFLRGKQAHLARCAARDVADRGLGAGARDAATSLADEDSRVERSVLAELLFRGLHLARVGSLKQWVALQSNLDEVLQGASTVLTDLTCTIPRLGTRLGASPADLVMWGQRTWVELIAHQELRAAEQVAARLPAYLAYHSKVAERMLAHLHLTVANVTRTSWKAAQLLGRDAAQAHNAAQELLLLLREKAPAQRTKFESYMCADADMMSNLEEFATQAPPTLLWKRQGRFAPLFRFLPPASSPTQTTCWTWSASTLCGSGYYFAAAASRWKA